MADRTKLPVIRDESGRPVFREVWKDDRGNEIEIQHAEPVGFAARVNKGSAVYDKTKIGIMEAIAHILHGGQ